MTWRIDYNAELGVMDCVYSDHVSAAEFEAGTLKTIALAKQHRTHLILIDDSELTSAVSTMEIYEMPRFYAGTDANRKSKWAIILPPGGQIREDVKFYATMCLNRGWYLKAFDDRKEAIDWLLNESEHYRSEGDDE